jgi:hypothetical protein
MKAKLHKGRENGKYGCQLSAVPSGGSSVKRKGAEKNRENEKDQKQ